MNTKRIDPEAERIATVANWVGTGLASETAIVGADNHNDLRGPIIQDSTELWHEFNRRRSVGSANTNGPSDDVDSECSSVRFVGRLSAADFADHPPIALDHRGRSRFLGRTPATQKCSGDDGRLEVELSVETMEPQAIQLDDATVFGTGESLAINIPILPSLIWAGDPAEIERIKDVLREAQTTAKERGLDLGDLVTVGLGPRVGWGLNPRVGTKLLPEDVRAAKFPEGICGIGVLLELPFGLGVIPKAIADFDKDTVVFRTGERDLRVILHELFHILNNLGDRDFLEEFDISFEEEHDVKDALSFMLMNIIKYGIHPAQAFRTWITFGSGTRAGGGETEDVQEFTDNQRLAAGAILREYGIRIGSTRYPPPR